MNSKSIHRCDNGCVYFKSNPEYKTMNALDILGQRFGDKDVKVSHVKGMCALIKKESDRYVIATEEFDCPRSYTGDIKQRRSHGD